MLLSLLNSKGLQYQFWLVLLVCALSAGIAIWSRTSYDHDPIVGAIFSGASAIAMFGVLLRYSPPAMFWLTNWFFFVCCGTVLLIHGMRTGEKIRKTEWERNIVLIVVSVVGGYALYVYPKMVPQFGGGAPVPVILHFSKQLATFDSESSPASLLDETEQGFYVLRGDNSDKAIFVARPVVEEVEFLRTLPDASQPSPKRPNPPMPSSFFH